MAMPKAERLKSNSQLLTLKHHEWTIESVDFLSYRIGSESEPGKDYFVDLSEYDGNGKCDCIDFRAWWGPVLEGTKQVEDLPVAVRKRYRRFGPVCKHIVIANLHVCKAAVRQMIKNRE